MQKIILAGIFFIMMSVANFASAAEIEKAFFDNNPELVYPVVKTENIMAGAKINSEIRKDIQNFLDDIKSRVGDDLQTISISYSVPCNHKGEILSIILSEYVMVKNAAHPWNLVHTLNFNSDSGARLTVESLSEIANPANTYTPAELTRKLKLYSKINNRPLNWDFNKLDKVPEDFYFDDNLHVHFLFQQQSVAPYAVGVIDLDADAFSGIVDTNAD